MKIPVFLTTANKVDMIEPKENEHYQPYMATWDSEVPLAPVGKPLQYRNGAFYDERNSPIDVADYYCLEPIG